MQFESIQYDQEFFCPEYGDFVAEDFTTEARVMNAIIGEPFIQPSWEETDALGHKFTAFDLHERATKNEIIDGAWNCNECNLYIFPPYKMPDPESIVVWDFYFSALSIDEPMPEQVTLEVEMGTTTENVHTAEVVFFRVGFFRVLGHSWQNLYVADTEIATVEL